VLSGYCLVEPRIVPASLRRWCPIPRLMNRRCWTIQRPETVDRESSVDSTRCGGRASSNLGSQDGQLHSREKENSHASLFHKL